MRKGGARDGSRIVSVALEKVQVSALAQRLGDLLEELEKRGIEGAEDVPNLLGDTSALDEPINEAFRDWVQGLPETIGLFVVSGAEDFLVHVAVADNEALYAFVIDRLTQRPEVADVRTSVVYEHLRTRVVEPLEPSRRRR